MAGNPSKETLKQQAIAALAESRADLRLGFTHAREQFNPRTLAQNTVRKHGLIVLAGAALGGFIVARVLFSGSKQNSRDTVSKSATKSRSIAGLILGGVWGLAREPLLALAAQKAMPIAMHYLEKLQSPTSPSQSPLASKPAPFE